MIRRGIIVILLLAALASMYLQVRSYQLISETQAAIDQHNSCRDWLKATASSPLRSNSPNGTCAKLLDRLPVFEHDMPVYAAAVKGVINVAVTQDYDSNLHTNTSDSGLGPFRLLKVNVVDPNFNITQFASAANTFSARANILTFPIWFVIALLLVYPVIAFFRGPVRRRSWKLRGDCGACGYLLTGVTENRCPECGRKFSPQRRDQLIVRFRERHEQAAQWRETYARRSGRRWLARIAFLFLVTLVLMWPVSYFRPAIRTPWFNCRIVWGTVAMFARDGDVRDFDFSFDGYNSGETWFWPFDMVNLELGRVIIPIWLLAIPAAAIWFALYRPDRHALAKKRKAALDEMHSGPRVASIADMP